MRIIDPHEKDLGGFMVRRALPQATLRAVGPFVFVDHIGPARIAPGDDGINVRSHPHIGIATVTYLFEGTFVHRDSLDVVQAIYPGDVNWMVAGRGIVHSERAADAERQRGQRLHGIQTWYALPQSLEECAPTFSHHPAASLPGLKQGDVDVVVVLGSAFGAVSPVPVPVSTLYAMATLPPKTTLMLPAEHDERSVYVVEGDVSVDGEGLAAFKLGVVEHAGDVVIAAGDQGARLALIGGAALDGHRFMEWNFVSSRKERIAEAVTQWRTRAGGVDVDAFPVIATDRDEFIPY
jgi:redox-sensitive bicupin YhaK (pirin superfamily)